MTYCDGKRNKGSVFNSGGQVVARRRPDSHQFIAGLPENLDLSRFMFSTKQRPTFVRTGLNGPECVETGLLIFLEMHSI